MNNSFARQMRDARLSLNISQAELAELAEIKFVQRISTLEAGTATTIRFSELAAICRVLKIESILIKEKPQLRTRKKRAKE